MMEDALSKTGYVEAAYKPDEYCDKLQKKRLGKGVRKLLLASYSGVHLIHNCAFYK